MSSGVGRGRGWLKLKNQNPPPGSGGVASPTSNHSLSPNLSSSDNRHYSDVNNDYSNLITNMKQLNVNDDGIKFNQKIKYIIEGWTQDCQNAPEVEKSFEAIHQACLADSELSTKLVLLIASRTFLSQEIHEQNIRLMFLRKLQDNFESSVQMQQSNSNAFRNSVQMMGEFFNKARLANGQQFSFMATPLISYLDMLLDSAQSLDLKLFTIQLYLNGSSLKSECPEKMAEILNKVRLILCSEKRFAKECKLWLLLALEVSSNRFALLPADVHKFYQEHLGDHAMGSFQGNHGTLTVQTTHNSKTLDSYQSNVNVLQVSTPPESVNDPVSPQPSTITDYGSSVNYSSSGFQSDTSQNSNLNRKDNQHNKGGKAGRPILGAGARLQRNRNDTDSTGNWSKNKAQDDTDTDTTTNWSINRPQNDDSGTKWNKNRTQTDSDSTGTANWSKSRTQNDSGGGFSWRERDNLAIPSKVTCSIQNS